MAGGIRKKCFFFFLENFIDLLFVLTIGHIQILNLKFFKKKLGSDSEPKIDLDEF